MRSDGHPEQHVLAESIVSEHLHHFRAVFAVCYKDELQHLSVKVSLIFKVEGGC